jgi:hypothetical protein
MLKSQITIYSHFLDIIHLYMSLSLELKTTNK